VAVLLRTHAQTRAFEEELVRRNVPHQVLGGLRFYERREIKDALAYLRLLQNRADDSSFLRAVNVPPRGVGDATQALLGARARERGVSLWEASETLLEGDEISGRARIGLTAFRALIEGFSSRQAPAKPSAALRAILQDAGLLAAIEAEGEAAARERRENLDQLVASALEYEEGEREPSLAAFLDRVSLLTDADTLETPAPCLLMTIHGAKGLEFDAVFLAGLEEGLFPHVRSAGNKHALEEERRLFYVGITRAKDRLYLVRSVQRGGRGYAEETYPSRFLDDIPPGLLVGKARSGRSLRGRPPETLWSASRQSSPSAPVLQSKYRAGTRVRHPIWDEGIVLDSRIQDDDEIVDVVFESVGIKRLAASLANLTIIK
jgi:DNA helicase-2/ATP-dependent DNA helicase PcrA